MLSLTSTRVKKAILHPKEAIFYIKNYLKGQTLRLKLKLGLLRVPKIAVEEGLKNYNYRFFTDNEKFLEEAANQNFIISVADKILNNEFGFLGILPKNLKHIDWREDIKSGYSWPKLFYLDLREAIARDYTKNTGRDIRNVWELSRFNYLIPLALAYYKTEDKKYLLKWQSLIGDWLEKNPVYYGPNWILAMEAAIRATNWVFSYEIIKKKLTSLYSQNEDKESTLHKLTPNFLNSFYTSLLEHGIFIFNNLEYAPVKSNHYLSDIVGLVYLGLVFQKTKQGQKWLNFAVRAIKQEIKDQVYQDGVDYELAITYHRYATELFLWSSWLLKLNEVDLGTEFWQKLKQMVNFTSSYTKPNDLAPQIGDSEDSRLHLVWENYYNWEKRNHFALLKLSIYIFENENNHKKNTSTLITSFPQAGFYLIKDKDFYLITGRNKACYGKGGSHTHNDLLSFELNYEGEDFIIDSGTYCYTSNYQDRNRFRSTRAHNTVMIDGAEQDVFWKDPFFIEQKAQLKVIEISENDKEAIITLSHNGYQRVSPPIVHQRKFSFDKTTKNLIIADSFESEGKHCLEWNFHLTPEIKLWLREQSEDSQFRDLILLGKKNKLLLTAPFCLDCAIIDDEVSPSYGVKVPAKTIRFSGFFLPAQANPFLFKIKQIKT